MKVIKVSDTIQEFNGVRYYKAGPYFSRAGKKLHIEVWKYHNGEIPKGMHIHHIDSDTSNNDIENLEMLTASDHAKKHSRSEERMEYARMHIERDMRQKAIEWHKSPEGLEWHSKQGKDNWKKRTAQKYICTNCGKEFETYHIYGKDENTFCSNACKSAYRLHSGVDNEERTCELCGKTFTTNKYYKKRFCSRSCAMKWSRAHR